MSTQNRLRYADSVEGIDVEKRYDEAEFPFPSVVYEFTSTRDEPVEVSVEDVLPDAVDAENVGFHADYNGADWTVEGDRLIFERDLEPMGECRTIYAVSATETEDPSDIFVEPSDITVSPPTPAADSPTDGSVHRSERGATPIDAGGNGTDPGRPDSVPEAGDMGSVLGAVAAEVEGDDFDRRDLDVLASAVAESMGDASGSVDARLSRIESDVAELRAYSDAIAEFLDENGGAAAVLDEFEQRVGTLASTLDDVSTQTDDLEEEVTSIRRETDDLEADVDALSDSLDELAVEVDDLRSSVGQASEGRPMHERVESLEDRLTEFEGFVDNVRAAFE